MVSLSRDKEMKMEDRKKFSFASAQKGLLSHSILGSRYGTSKQIQIPPSSEPLYLHAYTGDKNSQWTRQLEVQEFSRRLAYHGDHILEERNWIKSINGPGWQDLLAFPIDRGITFPKAERFPEQRKKVFDVAGPGTYGKNHDPYFMIEQKSRAKGFSHSVLPSFEQYSFGRGKNLGTQLYLHLPPNLYNLKNSIDELIKKKVSKRGPYDLFTGPRFPEKVGLRTKLILRKIDPSHLNHPKNAFKGKFLRCGMKTQMTSRATLTDLSLCKKNPLDPGPNYYDPYPPPHVRHSKYPFNSSAPNLRTTQKSKLYPPPGRYNPNMIRKIPGDGQRSAFISTVEREFFHVAKNSWFE